MLKPMKNEKGLIDLAAILIFTLIGLTLVSINQFGNAKRKNLRKNVVAQGIIKQLEGFQLRKSGFSVKFDSRSDCTSMKRRIIQLSDASESSSFVDIDSSLSCEGPLLVLDYRAEAEVSE